LTSNIKTWIVTKVNADMNIYVKGGAVASLISTRL